MAEEGTIDDLRALRQMGIIPGDAGDRRDDMPVISGDMCIDTGAIAKEVSRTSPHVPASRKGEIYADMVQQEADIGYYD